MNHGTILKRAWHILIYYRILWVFGFLVALTAGSWGGSSFWQNEGQRNNWEGDWEGDPNWDGHEWQGWQGECENLSCLGEDGSLISFLESLGVDISDDHREDLSDKTIAEVVSALVSVVLVFIGLILCIGLVATILRYVGRTALIRMVDAYEETGEKMGVRQGFRLGWSREAWRIFLIDLAVALPIIIIFALLLGLAVLPVTMLSRAGGAVSVAGIITSIGCFFLLVFFVMVGVPVLMILLRFFRRAAILGNLGVSDAIQEGYTLARQHLMDVGLMGLIVIGIQLGWSVIIVPVFFLAVALALMSGGITGLVVSGITGLFAGEFTRWIITGIVGGGVGITVMISIVTLVTGWREVYTSGVWTLTYRELRALETLSPEPEAGPGDDVPGLEDGAAAD